MRIGKHRHAAPVAGLGRIAQYAPALLPGIEAVKNIALKLLRVGQQRKRLDERLAESHVGKPGRIQIHAESEMIKFRADAVLRDGNARGEQGYAETEFAQQRREQAVPLSAELSGPANAIAYPDARTAAAVR